MNITMNAVLREEDVMNPDLTAPDAFGLTDDRGLEILSHLSKVSDDGGNKAMYFMEYVNTLTDQEKLYMMYVGYTATSIIITAQQATMEALVEYIGQEDE